jgi:hypothetical protein
LTRLENGAKNNATLANRFFLSPPSTKSLKSEKLSQNAQNALETTRKI